MNKVVAFLLLFMGVGLLMLGMVFIMAYEADIMNAFIGAGMVLVGLVTMAFAVFALRRPTVVQQNLNIELSGSGRLSQMQLKCKTCGGPLEDKDLRLVSGGMMFTCSYCGAVGQFEEEPKW